MEQNLFSLSAQRCAKELHPKMNVAESKSLLPPPVMRKLLFFEVCYVLHDYEVTLFVKWIHRHRFFVPIVKVLTLTIYDIGKYIYYNANKYLDRFNVINKTSNV